MNPPLRDETPAARLARWLRPSPAELTGLAILMLGAAVASGLLWLQATQRPSGWESGAGTVGVAVAPDGSTDGPAPGVVVPPPDSDPGRETGATVHVTGAVDAPGLVVLPEGARVGDAVAAAGGMITEAAPERINLARLVVDGEHVHVPRVGEDALPTTDGTAAAAPLAAPSPGFTPDGRIDLNRATPAELETLPGVGPARAEAIVAYRDEHGPFLVPGDLRGVPGIGDATFQRLAELVTVG